MNVKLIDILVKELPKRGGWPAEAIFAMQDSDGLVKFSRSGEKIYHDNSDGHEWCSEGGYDWIRDGFPFEGNFRTQVSQDNATAFIGRAQYESALAAIKPEWDGDGLPPVGCECEVVDKNGHLVYGHGESGEVIAHIENTAVIRMSYGLGCFSAGFLRPIRSEEEKKHDEIIEALKEGLGHAHGLYDLMQIYHLLNNGKIPHIRID